MEMFHEDSHSTLIALHLGYIITGDLNLTLMDTTMTVKGRLSAHEQEFYGEGAGPSALWGGCHSMHYVRTSTLYTADLWIVDTLSTMECHKSSIQQRL